MKTTLQTRLINLLVVSSLFLIGVFTAIALTNQIQKTREFNLYQARQEAFVVRDRLQEIFSPYAAGASHSAMIAEVKNVFRSTLESGAIEMISLVDSEGKPVILEGNLKLFFEVDKTFVKEISTAKDKAARIISVADKEHKIINIFVTFNNPHGYILKMTFSLASIQSASRAIYGPMMVIAVFVIFGNIILGLLLSRAMIWPIKILNEATKKVGGGNLNLQLRVDTGDELEELTETFNYMTRELIKMKMKAENANPLTKLPGNIVIREETEKRIAEGKKFVLIYCDLDNFKAFNDKYGVYAGDSAIMLVADIIKEAVGQKGGADDFIGHEGGDDFLLLTVPERADTIASYIIREFDERIRNLYSKEDRGRGYIETRGRDSDEVIKFPIMTISLAGVNNIAQEIASYAQVVSLAAEMKKLAKKRMVSNFVMNRRAKDLGIAFREKE